MFLVAAMFPTLALPCLVCSLILLLSPSPSTSQHAFIPSRATFYGSPDCFGTPTGACGYGELGRGLNGGDVTAVSRLYHNGSGCGACYHVRCAYPEFCHEDGLNVMVTDYGEGDNTDFILNARAFAKLAHPNMAAELMSWGVVDVEYSRIPCRYTGYNGLMFQVTEHSKYPDYLALLVMVQAGKQDVLAVQLWQEECKEWKEMRRAYGAVFDIVSPPRGPMRARLLMGSDDAPQRYWFEVANALPLDWKEGVAYNSASQLP